MVNTKQTEPSQLPTVILYTVGRFVNMTHCGSLLLELINTWLVKPDTSLYLLHACQPPSPLSFFFNRIHIYYLSEHSIIWQEVHYCCFEGSFIEWNNPQILHELVPILANLILYLVHGVMINHMKAMFPTLRIFLSSESDFFQDISLSMYSYACSL
jgi:hypothetical protein